MYRNYLILLLLLTPSCKNEHHRDSNEFEGSPTPIVKVTEAKDSMVYSIIDVPSISKGQSFTIDGREIKLIDSLLISCIKKHNDRLIEEDALEKLIDDLENYKRQYVPFINAKGEKEVFINCFCLMPKDDRWKSDIIIFHDGGSCFFKVSINLNKNECYKIAVNGEA